VNSPASDGNTKIVDSVNSNARAFYFFISCFRAVSFHVLCFGGPEGIVTNEQTNNIGFLTDVVGEPCSHTAE